MKFLRGSKSSTDAAVDRARRTHDLLQVDALEVWPWWLERQRRPAFAGSVGIGDLGQVENTTGRSWVSVGALDGPGATVDPAGLVTPDGRSWSLDWWIGAEDRWYFPSTEANARQERAGAAPIIETSVRVPGGDIRQTVFGATAADGSPVTVIEIENLTPVPVALALAVRPATPLGAGRIDQVVSTGMVVEINGDQALVFDREPAHGLATGQEDCVHAVVAGNAGSGGSVSADSSNGVGTGAWIFPLAHTATLRCWLPTTTTADLPTLEVGDVASGWTRHLDKVARLELGDALYDRAYLAAATDLLRLAGRGIDVAPVGREQTWTQRDQLIAIDAMARCGLEREAADALGAIFGDGHVPATELERRWALRVIDTVASMARGTDAVEQSLGSIARMLHDLSDTSPATDSALAASLTRLGQPDVAQRAQEVSIGRTRPPSTSFGHDVQAETAGIVSGGDDADASLEALHRLLRVGAASGAWPTAVHPRLDVGAAGSGNDPVSSASVVRALSSLMVRAGESELHLLPVFSADWLGRSVEAHGLGTRFGRLSFAVRWHGSRPALLWELEQTWNTPKPVALSTPTLDPSWRSTDLSGEVLLAEPARAVPDGDEPISFQ